MATLAVEAIRDAGRPLTLSELEQAVLARGYPARSDTKNPRQLRASLRAPADKGAGIKRVGVGVYDVVVARTHDEGHRRRGL